MNNPVVPVRGMRDFLPAEKRKREQAIDKIRRVYRAFGYEEIETPVLESIDHLKNSEGGENLNMIFEVLKRGLSPTEFTTIENVVDLGLRYDLTLPLARFYASNISKLPSVFRAMQIGPVWRAERPQKGRFRQFTQCDIDIIGVADERAEIELITVTLLALETLNLQNVTVRLNDRQLLVDILKAFGFSEASYSTVLIVIDKLDKIGVSGVKDELNRRIAGIGEAIDRLIGFLDKVCSRSGFENDSFDTIPDILPSIVDTSLLPKLKCISDSVVAALPSAKIRFDPTLVRGLGYYTGPIFEIENEGGGSSIAGGGRYDGMIGRFCGKNVSACGFSLGFERIIGLLGDDTQVRDKKLALYYEPGIEYGAMLAQQRKLTELGYEVTPIIRPAKIGKAIQRAATEGFGLYVEVVSQDQSLSESDIKSTTRENSTS